MFLSPGALLYLGPGAAAVEHAHHAVQLIWSPQSPIVLRLAERVVTTHAALVSAGTPHAVDTAGATVALMLVERHAPTGVILDALARSPVGGDLSARLAQVTFPDPAMLTAHEAQSWSTALVRALGAAPASLAPSTASRLAVGYVEANLDTAPRLPAAARAAGISATRLTHLFTREVGLPFRRFVLWARIKRAVTLAGRGATLTEAAAAAGFSDSAHFTRTFHAMFGLPPSLVLPHAEIIGSAWTDAEPRP